MSNPLPHQAILEVYYPLPEISGLIWQGMRLMNSICQVIFPSVIKIKFFHTSFRFFYLYIKQETHDDDDTYIFFFLKSCLTQSVE